jgi:hypothetical protein
VETIHAPNPAAAIIHIPCMSYPPFGKRTAVAVRPTTMNPRMKQLTRATPQQSRRSTKEIVADESSGESVVFVAK